MKNKNKNKTKKTFETRTSMPSLGEILGLAKNKHFTNSIAYTGIRNMKATDVSQPNPLKQVPTV